MRQARFDLQRFYRDSGDLKSRRQCLIGVGASRRVEAETFPGIFTVLADIKGAARSLPVKPRPLYENARIDRG